ncbi:ABC transporter permease [Aeromicrobium sp. Leaf350]|uniref:ABC transporter permease n=1 Tax=Aeromicrobium sp. Leaf350 TaxID=2876565 RepID=UPI001E5C0E58|nr:ABC transporter permease subunit [Aeromicrobium sp. Leaf350]
MRWIGNNTDLILGYLASHVWLSIVPTVLGFLLALPIGWWANRVPAVRGVVLSVGNVLYTIPSLAFILILPGVIGTGFLDPLNIVIALTVYAVAVMARFASDGFASVSPAVLDSARASGFGAAGLALRVELPLAGPVLLAGLRVVSVSTVSLVSVGALAGVDNLGRLFTEGVFTGNTAEILTGIVLVVALALVLDLLLVIAGRALLPWSAGARRVRGGVA